MAALEGGTAGIATSAGQAANLITMLNIAQAGDHIIACANIYGGTFNLFAVTLKKMGIETTFINQNASKEEIIAAARPNTKALFGESLGNPALTVLDIEEFAAAAHEIGVPLGGRQYAGVSVPVQAPGVRRRFRHPFHDKMG